MSGMPHVVEIERVVVEGVRVDARLMEQVRRQVELAVMSALRSQEPGLALPAMERISARAGEGAAGALNGGEG